MFTGIVEELGRVRAVERRMAGARLSIACTRVVEDAAVGGSISVNGCCLTITTLPVEGGFTADLMGETLDRTALGGLAPGAPVNLERPLRVDGRLGGHLVQGHVDGVAEVLVVEPLQDWTVMRFSLPAGLERYVVEKGSVTVDGTSLTIMRCDLDERAFDVGLIPYTLAVTVLSHRSVGDRVNLEVDLIAKYVERLLAAGLTNPYQGR